MASYLVETYVPGTQAQDARAAGRRARAAARKLSREGVSVRYIRTTLLPGDETCFHLFDADCSEAVEEVCRRAGIGHARVVPAIEASRSKRPPAR